MFKHQVEQMSSQPSISACWLLQRQVQKLIDAGADSLSELNMALNERLSGPHGSRHATLISLSLTLCKLTRGMAKFSVDHDSPERRAASADAIATLLQLHSDIFQHSLVVDNATSTITVTQPRSRTFFADVFNQLSVHADALGIPHDQFNLWAAPLLEAQLETDALTTNMHTGSNISAPEDSVLGPVEADARRKQVMVKEAIASLQHQLERARRFPKQPNLIMMEAHKLVAELEKLLNNSAASIITVREVAYKAGNIKKQLDEWGRSLATSDPVLASIPYASLASTDAGMCDWLNMRHMHS